MTTTDEPTTSGDEPITVDTDVVIIGAGLSGIDIAYRLRERNPDVRYVILERAHGSAAPGICSGIRVCAPTATSSR